MFIEYSMMDLLRLASLFRAEQSPDALLEEGVFGAREDAPEMETNLIRINVRGHLVKLIHIIDDTALDIQIVFDLFVVDHCEYSMA